MAKKPAIPGAIYCNKCKSYSCSHSAEEKFHFYMEARLRTGKARRENSRRRYRALMKLKKAHPGEYLVYLQDAQ